MVVCKRMYICYIFLLITLPSLEPDTSKLLKPYLNMLYTPAPNTAVVNTRVEWCWNKIVLKLFKEICTGNNPMSIKGRLEKL